MLLVMKGLLWWFIELDRVREQFARARTVATLTVAGLFIIPSFWVGGSLYQVNKHLDTSAVSWHLSEVVDKWVSSGKTKSYVVELAAWDGVRDEPVQLTLRREQFEGLEIGACVEVGVRSGALEMAWVAELRSCGTLLEP